MATYVYVCDECDKTVEVNRPMYDYKRPPTSAEVNCANWSGCRLRRVIDAVPTSFRHADKSANKISRT
jgi:predicted nucleic acid-binding Zn ribbon protein